MSSTGQPISSTSNVQLIIDAALDDYTKITGTDLSKTPFATAIEQSDSTEAIIQLLHEREKVFKEYRDGNRKLINSLIPAVRVIQAFSGIVVAPAGQVSHTYHLVTPLTVTPSDPLSTSKRVVYWHRYSPCCKFPHYHYLLNRIPCDEWVCQAASGVTSSYDALLELFKCLGNFLKRMEVYTTIPPTPILADVVVKIMVELLSVLALASKQIKEGRFSTCNVTYITCRSMCPQGSSQESCLGKAR